MIKVIALSISLILGTLTSTAFTFSSPVYYVLVALGFTIAYLVIIISIFFLSALLVDIPVNTNKNPERYSRVYQKIFTFYVGCALSTFGVDLKAKGIEKLPKDLFE